MGDTFPLTFEATQTITINNRCQRCGKFDHYEIECPESLLGAFRSGETNCLCDDCAAEDQRRADERFAVLQEQRRLEATNIPAEFQNYDKAKGNLELSKSIWENRDKHLFIAGPNGCGKTRAATASLMCLFREKKVVRFKRFIELAQEYAKVSKDGEILATGYLKALLDGCDVLLIDDLAKRRINEVAGEMLYDIVDRIYIGDARCKLWITSNFYAQLSYRFENVDSGNAVLSRFDRMIADDRLVKLEGGNRK